MTITKVRKGLSVPWASRSHHGSYLLRTKTTGTNLTQDNVNHLGTYARVGIQAYINDHQANEMDVRIQSQSSSCCAGRRHRSLNRIRDVPPAVELLRSVFIWRCVILPRYHHRWRTRYHQDATAEAGNETDAIYLYISILQVQYSNAI